MPEPEKGGRGKTANSVIPTELSGGYLSHARTVIKWAPDLVDGVRAGAESLDRSYAIAVDRKTKAEVPEIRLAALRATDPDLAVQVVEGNVKLDDAAAAAKARRDTERTARQGLYDGLREIDRWMFMFRAGSNLDYLVAVCKEHPDELPNASVRKSIAGWLGVLNHANETLK